MLAVTVCVGQQVVADSTATKPADATDPQFQSRTTRYKIAPGDTFDLNFELSPEFNQSAVAVQPDGFVTLRGVGDVKVQGLTVPELTQTIRAAYSKTLNDPILSVVLKDFEKPYFVADGQVGKPGKYDLRGDITLTQAIAIAGGFTDASRHSQVLLFRKVSDQWMEAKIINVKKMEKAGKLNEDPLLHPGDMLFVPKNTFSKIDRFFPSASMGTFFPIPEVCGSVSMQKLSMQKLLMQKLFKMLFDKQIRCAVGFAVVVLASFGMAQQVVSSTSVAPAVSAESTQAAVTQAAATKADPQFQSRSPRYKIAPGDAFDVTFDLSPEFNQSSVAVQPDGFVTLRGIGEIQVKGLTTPELTHTLRKAYGKILNDPIITVILKDFEKPYFVADGQIGKPGKYDLRGDITLTQAIAIAGGFKDSSKHSQVLLFRRVSDQWMEAKIINVKAMEKAGNLKEDPMLHPGDMLFVPKNTMSKISQFIPTASMGSMFRPGN